MTGKEVIDFRKQFGLTIEDMAELIGITRQAVILWESDQRMIPEPMVRLMKLFLKHPHLKMALSSIL